MNTTTTISIILRHLVPALEAIQRDILEAERVAPPREPQNSFVQQQTSSKKLLNSSEAAEYLRLRRSSIYQMTSSRVIPFIKLGSRILFKEEQLATWLSSHEHTPDDLLHHRGSKR